MLKLQETPRFARTHLVMTHAPHKQRGQHRDAHGLLPAMRVPPDWGLAHPQARLQLPVQDRDGPTFLGEAYDGARRQLGQSGPQDFCRFGAPVSPSFAQDPRDFSARTPTQTRMKRPQGLAAVPRRLSGHPWALGRRLRPRGHEMVDRLCFRRLPGAGARTDQAPTARGLRFVPLLDPAPVGLGARRRLPTHEPPLRPPRGTAAATLSRAPHALRYAAWRVG
jgi:hypothetical protein